VAVKESGFGQIRRIVLRGRGAARLPSGPRLRGHGRGAERIVVRLVTVCRVYHLVVALAKDIGVALAPWLPRVDSVTPLGGGWNSSTWLVAAGDGRYVAKLVDHLDAQGLDAGLRLAEFAAARGLACGAPVRTRGGTLTIGLPEGALALLRHVPGNPPDLSAPDQVRRAGRVLARAHQVLREYPAGDEPRYRWPWDWVTRCLDTVTMPAGVNAAARRAWQQAVAAAGDHQLTISLIHADPGPDSFLLSTAGAEDDALIDWATPLRGPLLYDLASFAVLTRPAGADAARWFTEGYAQEMPEIGPQLAHLGCLVQARWVAHAIYFASRIERGIGRGPGAPDANEEGLAAAYAGMTAGSRLPGLHGRGLPA
jgi:Ser/Thr protein kinase RdoA (MazF antagonist)